MAGAAAWLEPASAAGNSKPVYVSQATATAPPSREQQPLHLADQTPVRVIGAPFVPNTNPRAR